MRIISILKRLYNGNTSYIFGRFLSVRKGYSLYKNLANTKTIRFSLKESTLFDKINVQKSLKALQKDAVAFGFDLPSNLVCDIEKFAQSCEFKADNVANTFYYKDIHKGRLADGTAIAIAYAVAPESCDSIQKILHDPILYQTVAQYLGYKPNNYELRLYYSVVSALTDTERRQRNQTIDYHFDVHAFNFCYAHFYITDKDKDSGAHALIKKSHVDKPFNFLLNSARRSNDEVFTYYKKDDELLIEAKAGSGFLEDTSCYHKALAPISQDRLLLQIRFF